MNILPPQLFMDKLLFINRNDDSAFTKHCSLLAWAV